MIKRRKKSADEDSTAAKDAAAEDGTAATEPTPAARRRHHFLLRVHAPSRSVVVTEVLTSVLIGVMAWRQVSWPWMVGVGVLLAVLGLCAFKDASLTHWAAQWRRWWRGHKRKSAAAAWAKDPGDDPQIFSLELPDGEGMAGLRWDGGFLVTAVALVPRKNTPTILDDGMAITTDTVPLDVLADCLWQFDIDLANIDYVGAGRRVVPGTAYARSYDQLIEVKPGLADFRGWAILRLPFDPKAAGIRRRGGGPEGALRAAVAATRRVARRLQEHNCGAVVADVEQLHAAHTALLAGLTAADTQIERGTLATPTGFVTTSRAHSDDLTSRNVGAWFATRCASTALIVRLIPGDVAGRVRVRTWVRQQTTTRPDRADRLPGLVRQYCDQDDAVTATLPLGTESMRAQQRMVSSTAPEIDADSLAAVNIPVGPGGQLIGYTSSGHPFLLPLTQPGRLTRVIVDAPLWVAQQLVLRSLPAGANARVSTTRPEDWWDMMRRLSEPRRLWLEQSDHHRVGDIQVCDGVPPIYAGGARTLLMVGNRDRDLERAADIVLRVNPHNGQATVTVGGRSWPVTLKVTKEESRYLGRIDDGPQVSFPAPRSVSRV